MRYPVVIHKDPDSDYSVTLPDLPGCFTAGESIEEALAMAVEAAELHIEGCIEEGIAVMDPSPIAPLRDVYAGGTWAWVEVRR
ncbi:MAG: type II toxin-antitoxin system HicB family antitoxin [Chromatiaceae bacterium]|nr:type II toxin-antitoxin system HicB family antitoxin [Chromatiaceae bacterium]